MNLRPGSKPNTKLAQVSRREGGQVISAWSRSASPLGNMEEDEYASSSPAALRGLYGKWLAVENASMALVEAANLLTIPGRRCANGRWVPVQKADWNQWVQGMRDAGLAAFKAAQTKNQDAIVEVSEALV